MAQRRITADNENTIFLWFLPEFMVFSLVKRADTLSNRVRGFKSFSYDKYEK
jgi:hypothetical protein